MIVRYADDCVMGFENKGDAQELLLALKERLGAFGLALHEGKTRLIEFGRFAAFLDNGMVSGNPKPRLLRLRPLLWADPRWQVYREAQDGRETPDAKAQGGARGGMAAYARATDHAA